MRYPTRLLILLLALCFTGPVLAQDETPAAAGDTPVTLPEPPKTDTTFGKTKEIVEKVEAEAEKLAKEIDKVPQAQKAAAGILQPIYQLAENIAFAEFHWLAFALMSAGVFSYALQLILGKLVVLTRMGFSLKEIASDAVGLAISVVGLVLTTQAATENSQFTQSPTAVISATIVGAILGIILYFWGQSQELEAAAGRSKPVVQVKKR